MTGLETAGRLGDAKASVKKTHALTIAEHCGNLSLRCPMRDSYPVHYDLTIMTPACFNYS
jgi:hypothetical protein